MLGQRCGPNDYVDASLHTRLAIPLVYGADAVHGHNG
jgi:hypothetical protein